MAGIIADGNKLGGVPQSSSKFVALSTCFDIYSNVGGSDLLVGFITSLNINHSRSVQQVRHINSIDAGLPVDIVVSPDTVSLSFNGLYIYNNTVAATNGLGSSAGRMGVGVQDPESFLRTLDQQTRPFDIKIVHNISNGNSTSSDAAATAGSRIIGVYKNCTISGMSIPITIANAALSDSGTIQVGYVAKA